MIAPIITADLDPSVLSNEIALDEALDALDPLRHLRGDECLGGDDDPHGILPAQPRSMHNELVRLSFSGSAPAIHIMLKIDATPGCGGIAWPAGEVRTFCLLDRVSFSRTRQTDHRFSQTTWPFAGRDTVQEKQYWNWAVGPV